MENALPGSGVPSQFARSRPKACGERTRQTLGPRKATAGFYESARRLDRDRPKCEPHGPATPPLLRVESGGDLVGCKAGAVTLAGVFAWAGEPVTIGDSHHLMSAILHEDRAYKVHLPASYARSRDQRCDRHPSDTASCECTMSGANRSSIW